jgi:hypothetical protein
MAPGGARRLKRESTVAFSGLITPDQSMYSAGSVTPKREIDVESVSDVLEDPFQGMTQHNGLPVDEGYQSMVIEQQRRSGMFLQLQILGISNSLSRKSPSGPLDPHQLTPKPNHMQWQKSLPCHRV